MVSGGVLCALRVKGRERERNREREEAWARARSKEQGAGKEGVVREVGSGAQVVLQNRERGRRRERLKGIVDES